MLIPFKPHAFYLKPECYFAIDQWGLGFIRVTFESVGDLFSKQCECFYGRYIAIER